MSKTPEKRQFAPLWAWILVLCAVVGFGRLSLWQYQRGQARALSLQTQDTAQHAPPIVTNPAAWLQLESTPKKWIGKNIQITGEARGDLQILLDGHSNGTGQPGVQVLMPVLLGNGVMVMVNRGWLSTDTMRLPQALDFPRGQTTWHGQWQPISKAAFGTGSLCPTSAVGFPWRALYPTREVLACVLKPKIPDQKIADGVLLLAPEADKGFVRSWQTFLLPPERHYGYAVQWALLAMTSMVLFILLNRKRAKK